MDTITRLNSFFQSSENIFHLDGYIRLNMLYFSPINIKKLKDKLMSIGLTSWELKENGLFMNFDKENVIFQGMFSYSLKDSEFFAFELDFEPVVSAKKMFVTLYELESYLKGLDAVFFMTYEVNATDEVMENPLAYSVDYLYKKVDHNESG